MRLGEAANAKFAAASSKKTTAGAYDITPVALRIDRRDHQGLSMMDKERIALLRGAFDAYLEKMGSHYLEPTSRYLPYDFQELKDRHWIQPGGMLVLDELNELTNSINYWASSLRRWHAWNEVTRSYSEYDSWLLGNELVFPLAHQCLLQPSTTRDVLTLVATNAVHQLRLAGDGNYRDQLEGDPISPEQRQKHLTRRNKEKRLESLVSSLTGGCEFMHALGGLDDEAYRQETTDYRNRVSHGIGPSLGLGQTNLVTRSVTQAEKLIAQLDGTWALVPVPGKMAVSYAIGGMEPLDMAAAHAANLAQYHRARACYEAYLAMLRYRLAPTTD